MKYMYMYFATLWLLATTANFVASQNDFAVIDGDFEFIFHQAHHLLLTLHNGSCYFAFMEADLHDQLIIQQFFTKLQDTLKIQILDGSSDHGQIRLTSQEEMRDMFKDRLADFHCMNSSHIYIVHIDYLSCDFEDSHNHFCTWTSDTAGTNLQWRPHQGETNTPLTGPHVDHTEGTDAGTYLYLEANTGLQGDKAELKSVVLNALEGLCVRFWYNMYGNSVGTLTVRAEQEKQPWHNMTLWTLSGNQGQGWKVAEASVPVDIFWTYTMRVFIAAVHGDGQYGDVAIDDISSTTGICEPDKFTCSFETDLCQWSNVEQTDEMEWERHSGPTATQGTGPIHADVGIHPDNRYYIYVDADSHTGGHPNNLAVLQSELVVLKESVCLIFHYHMNGTGVGELDVILRKWSGRAPEDTVLYNLAGSQGTSWKEARVTVPAPTTQVKIQVLFQATRGTSAMGDIAVDSIRGLTGSCEQYSNTQQVPGVGDLIG